jgi:hypothetical protein
MPAAGWSAISTIGFKYKDSTLANGPVEVAQIKKMPSGSGEGAAQERRAQKGWSRTFHPPESALSAR